MLKTTFQDNVNQIVSSACLSRRSQSSCFILFGFILDKVFAYFSFIDNLEFVFSKNQNLTHLISQSQLFLRLVLLLLPKFDHKKYHCLQNITLVNSTFHYFHIINYYLINSNFYTTWFSYKDFIILKSDTNCWKKLINYY